MIPCDREEYFRLRKELNKLKLKQLEIIEAQLSSGNTSLCYDDDLKEDDYVCPDPIRTRKAILRILDDTI